MSFVIGGASTYLGLYWKVRKELEAEYDKDLRASRLRVYSTLWSKLELLAKYSRPQPVNAESLDLLSAKLRQWYFEDGGIYMSQTTRDAYFSLQDELQHVLPSDKGTDRRLSAEDFERLRRAGSALRTAMTVDVGTRRAPLLGEETSD